VVAIRLPGPFEAVNGSNQTDRSVGSAPPEAGRGTSIVLREMKTTTGRRSAMVLSEEYMYPGIAEESAATKLAIVFNLETSMLY
jgi:hypothetical protein